MVKRRSACRRRRRPTQSSCDDGMCGRRRKNRLTSRRSGEDLRNTVGEYRQQARELMPIYELLEDSVAVEKLLKDRIEDFNYIRDKTSQLSYSKVVEFLGNGQLPNGDDRFNLVTKIIAFYAKMKKVAKDVSKEIKKEYTASIASQYTLERIMFIFRKAAAGMTSYKGKGFWGRHKDHKCPDAIMSKKQQAMRELFKTKKMKVGTAEASKAITGLTGNGKSHARNWKNCMSPLEAMVLFLNVPVKISKKWGVVMSRKLSADELKLGDTFVSQNISSKASAYASNYSTWIKP